MVIALAASLSAKAAEMFRKRLETKLLAAKVDFPILKSYKYYVNRPSLEERIRQVYESRLEDRFGSYTIIVGSKATGKSLTTAHVLNNQPRVLFLKVNQADTESSLLRRLLHDCGVPIKGSIDVGLDAIIPSLLHVAKVGNGLLMTIVLEVECWSSSDGLLKMIQSVAEELALAANVIIILSEANAGLAFIGDPRQNFIWVDGMTDVEATAFAKKVFPAINDHDLESFFEKVGTHPYEVGKLAKALKLGQAADAYTEATLRAAASDLSGFTHTPILKALKISPDGVSTDEFQGVKHKGVNLAQPKDVAVAMKEQTAIVYHIPSGEYRLASRAHRTALLERLDPKG